MHQAPHVSRRSIASRRLSDNRGFTLVEVTAAAFVLLFAIASSLVAMQWGFRSLDLARGITLASQVIQSELESVRMRGWSEIAAMTIPDDAEPYAFDDEDIDPEILSRFTSITRAVRRRLSDGSEMTGMREITITATWRTVDGITHTRSTSTRYCMNGLYDYFATDPTE